MKGKILRVSKTGVRNHKGVLSQRTLSVSEFFSKLNGMGLMVCPETLSDLFRDHYKWFRGRQSSDLTYK